MSRERREDVPVLRLRRQKSPKSFMNVPKINIVWYLLFFWFGFYFYYFLNIGNNKKYFLNIGNKYFLNIENKGLILLKEEKKRLRLFG